MNDRLIIVGAGGHGKVVADTAYRNGYGNIGFLDDHATGACLGFPILGKIGMIEALDDGKTDFVIAVGDNGFRRTVAERYRVNWVTLVHPSAQIALGTAIGSGTVVLAGAVVNPCAQIGKHCIINTGAIVEHDNQIADYAHISPGAALGGAVSVGEGTHVGIGAAVKNAISICGGCVIGAGAVVVKNIEKAGVYVGAPAKEKL